MRFSFSLLLFTLFMLAQAPVAGADKVLLLPRWETGKIYRQQTVTEIQLPLPGAAATPGQNTSITQMLDITVSKEAGTEQKLASIKALLNTGGQTLAYDSTDAAKSLPFLQQTFGALAGKTFTLVYDKEDKFLDVRAADGQAGTPLGTTKAMDVRQLADAFRKSQDLALPKAAVAPGDTWTFTDKLDMPPVGTFAIKATGRFDSIAAVDGRKHAKLLLDGTLENPAGAQQLVQFGPGSKFSGEILFDLDRKVVASSIVKTELKLTISGQEAPMSQTATTKLIGVETSK